jgi:hypothetical protein
MTLKIVLKGGPGSGHHGHAGRPGQRGGSVSGSVAMSLRTGMVASTKRILNELRDNNYTVVYASKEAIIAAEWDTFSKSSSMERAVQREFDLMRSDVRRTIPRELVRKWSKSDLSVSEVRTNIEKWTQSELDKKRSSIESDIESRYISVRAEHYGDSDIIITNQDALHAMATGLLDAHNAGNIGTDVAYILRNPSHEAENWLSGTYNAGRVTILNSGYNKLGIVDVNGSFISKGGMYRQRTIEEPIQNSAFLYSNWFNGIATHEYGHHVSRNNPAIEDRAATVIKTHGEDVKNIISDYAWTNEGEAAAESYALRRHPDYSMLPKESRRNIEYILGGN